MAVRTTYGKVRGKKRAGIKVGKKFYAYDRRITRSKFGKKFAPKYAKY